MSALNKREYLVIPLDLCFFDRVRYDRMRSDLPTEILSYRKFDDGLLRVIFSTRAIKGKEKAEETQHLLWIKLIELEGKRYVKYRCDCKYFEYRQFRPAKRVFGIQEIDNDLCVVVDPKNFDEVKKLFNIDKHAFLALKQLLNVQVQISI